jgi:pullulanase/glycogen debranching enzyme
VLILLNAADEALTFALPEAQASWQLHIDTALAPWTFDDQNCEDDSVRLEGRSLVLLVADSAVPDLETASSTEAAD